MASPKEVTVAVEDLRQVLKAAMFTARVSGAQGFPNPLMSVSKRAEQDRAAATAESLRQAISRLAAKIE